MSHGTDMIHDIIHVLLRKIVQRDTTSEDLIAIMESSNIPPNTYCPSLSPNSDAFYPLIYYCCMKSQYLKFFHYLIKKGCDITHTVISSNPSDKIELLYYADIIYIPYLVELGLRLERTSLTTNITNMLIKGNYQKVMMYVKYGAMSKTDLYEIIHTDDLIFTTLDNLYGKLVEIGVRSLERQIDPASTFTTIVENYVKVFQLYFRNGITPLQYRQTTDNANTSANTTTTDNFLQLVLDTYIYEIIELVFTIEDQIDLDGVRLRHFSSYPKTTRRVLKYFYNDATYQRLDKLLDQIKTPKIIIHDD